MRIKDYTDTVRHLTDSFNIPEARRMIQENPALTQEQFKMAGLSESFPGTFTSYNDAVSEGFQGTREEWLQQQSIPQIERPLTGAEGGRVGMKPGGIVEPGVVHYGKKSVSPKESLRRIEAIKNYIKKQGKVIDGSEFKAFLSDLGYTKPISIVKGLEQGGMFAEDMLGNKTITETERPLRRGIFFSKSQKTVLDKYAALLNKQNPEKYPSSKWIELGEAERGNIKQRARGNDWKFKAKTKWDPLTLKQQQNIIDVFNLPEDAFKKMEGLQKNIKDVSGKYGVPRLLDRKSVV